MPRISILLLLGLGAGQERLVAQPAPTTLAESYARARALLDSAMVAHGGRETITKGNRLVARMDGRDHWRNQSRRIAPPYDTEPWTGVLYLDAPAARLVWETTSGFPGGFKNAGRTVIDGTRGFNANLRQANHTPVPNRAIATQRAVLFRLPHLVLQDAVDNAASLRWLGNLALSDGTRVLAIGLSLPPGVPVTLGFDPQSKLLRVITSLQSDPTAGDAASETVFSDYRQVSGVSVPGRRIIRIAGEITTDIIYRSIEFGVSVPDSLLQPPRGSVDLPPSPPNTEPVRELAPGVWVVRGGGYWSLVVGYRDHVLVMEAPGGGSSEVIGRVGQLAPGKPIRYVVPTHHHDDHAGGMREYIATGATIVTTPGNRPYFERMARAHSSIRPDSLSRAPRPPSFEILTSKTRVFAGGGPTVEIHSIGPSPHAEEMLVAWLPEAGILFQGDLLNLGTGVVYPNSANLTTAHFADWVKQVGLDVKILAGVHMPPGTIGQLNEALATSDLNK